jgi:transcriptional regulator with XRE-family HTH domain
MSDVRTGALRSFVAPRINTDIDEAKVDFGDSGIVLYGAATGGKSTSVRIPKDPMKLYADYTGFLNGFAALSNERPKTGGSAILPMFGLFGLEEPKFADVITVFLGPEGPVAYLPQVPMPFSATNLTPLDEFVAAKRRAKEAQLAALHDIQRQLDKEKAAFAQRSPADVVRELTDDLGLSQLAIARAIDVSPTAVRKWRRGESTRPEHRDTLALLGAFARVLERHVHDPSGWMEIPVSAQSTITPLDLFVGRALDLAVLFAAGLSDPDETLGAFKPDWRKEYGRDPDYEVVTLRDGSRSAVPRREDNR